MTHAPARICAESREEGYPLRSDSLSPGPAESVCVHIR